MARKRRIKEGPYIQTARARKRPGKTVREGGTVVIRKAGKRPLAFKKGALTEEAKRHGYSSPKAYCEAIGMNTGWKKGVSTTTKRRCIFAFKGALAKGRETASAHRRKK